MLISFSFCLTCHQPDSSFLTESAQLSYLGLTIVLGRLTVEVFDPEDPTDRPDIELALSSALALVEDVVVFCEKLTLTDVANFWISCEPASLT